MAFSENYQLLSRHGAWCVLCSLEGLIVIITGAVKFTVRDKFRFNYEDFGGMHVSLPPTPKAHMLEIYLQIRY